MFVKKIKFIFIIFLLYQTPINSKSTSFENFNSKNLSQYFSGIVAFENKENTQALDFFNSAKVLLDEHEPYLKRYIYTLVLDNKVSQAINIIKNVGDKKNTNFFEAHLLLILDSLKKNDFDLAFLELEKMKALSETSRFNSAILESLEQYIFVFKEKKILKNRKNYGKLSLIAETFQRCYLNDENTDTFFSQLFNDPESDYSRYIFFYLSYLIEKKRNKEAEEIINNLNFINTSLLLSQGKSWIENGNSQKLIQVFSCQNNNDVMSEFLFLISNLYSSQDNFNKSNFYLNLSIYLNPDFIFNLSLVAENYYLNKEFKKTKKILKNFKKEDHFYYWYRIKKEAQIIKKERNKKDSMNYIKSEFNNIENINNKFLFDIANFYKNYGEYEEAIKYYTKIIESTKDDEVKSDLFYRRGGSYERMKEFKKADLDLLAAIDIKPNDAYILNYLAYSWLERNYKINEAINMLETAYSLKSDDPYIIDSIGWAYFLTNDFIKAENFLKRAVELMPDDPIVNDHYGDILWKLNRKIQARYFWNNVLKMDDAESELIKKIQIKIIDGLKNS